MSRMRCSQRVDSPTLAPGVPPRLPHSAGGRRLPQTARGLAAGWKSHPWSQQLQARRRGQASRAAPPASARNAPPAMRCSQYALPPPAQPACPCSWARTVLVHQQLLVLLGKLGQVNNLRGAADSCMVLARAGCKCRAPTLPTLKPAPSGTSTALRSASFLPCSW